MHRSDDRESVHHPQGMEDDEEGGDEGAEGDGGGVEVVREGGEGVGDAVDEEKGEGEAEHIVVGEDRRNFFETTNLVSDTNES